MAITEELAMAEELSEVIASTALGGHSSSSSGRTHQIVITIPTAARLDHTSPKFLVFQRLLLFLQATRSPLRILLGKTTLRPNEMVQLIGLSRE